MKLLDLAPPPDPKADFRAIAKAAKEGATKDPPLSAPVELWPVVMIDPHGDGIKTIAAIEPSKEDQAKFLNHLRVGLRSLNEGRFDVTLVKNLGYVSVSNKSAITRTRKPKTEASHGPTGTLPPQGPPVKAKAAAGAKK